MKKILFILLILIFIPVFAEAAAPYSNSTYITGISWDHDNRVQDALGSDLFYSTWGPGDYILTSWGDGCGFEDACEKGQGGTCVYNGTYYSGAGVSKLTGTPPNYTVSDVCGHATCADSGDCETKFPVSGSGKIADLLALEGTVYALMNEQNDPTWPDLTVRKSTDNGETWSNPIWTFYTGSGVLVPQGWVNYGQNYAGAREEGKYVYFTANLGGEGRKSIFMGRVLKEDIEDKNEFEWYSSTNPSNPTWNSNPANRQAIFYDAAGAMNYSGMVYNPDIGRYLMVTYHGSPPGLHRLGIFEAPEPWGPWHTIEYNESWGSITGTTYGFASIPAKWITDNGETFWLFFSADDGDGNFDSFNMVEATLTMTDYYVRPSGGNYGLEDGTSYANAWDGFRNVGGEDE
jgi:hypothetical protein